jgi:hypothetical protein
MRAAQKLLGAPTIGGGVPRWRESKESNGLLCRLECTKTAKKQAVLRAFWPINRPKHRYLTRYTPKTFLEEYINFKIFCYLGIVELYLFKVSICLSRPD